MQVMTLTFPTLPPSAPTLHPFLLCSPQESVIDILGELLKNPVNEALVVKVATQYSEQLTPEGAFVSRVWEEAPRSGAAACA
jgi:hypothetical protein